MIYDKAFNTPLVVFTTFPGEMTAKVPRLTWVRRYSEAFGAPASGRSMRVYSSGGSFIIYIYGSDGVTRTYCYGAAAKAWVLATTTTMEIVYYGNGVYLGVNNRSTYVSFNGRNWSYCGYLPNLINTVICAASDGVRGAMSAQSAGSPMYIKSNLTTSNTWTLAGDWFTDGMCCFESMTCRNGMFAGIASDTIVGSGKGGIQISSSGAKWYRTMQYPKAETADKFIEMRSIRNKLFLRTYTLPKVSGDKIVYQLCLMNDKASNYTVVREGSAAEIPTLGALQFIDALGRYLYFADGTIYSSVDGRTWDATPQTNFSGDKTTAIHIPGDGFYVGMSGSYVLYAAYP